MLSKHFWKFSLILYTFGIFLILYLAYSNGVPSSVAVIPHYDLVFHFLLYGLWSYLAYRAFSRKLWAPGTLTLLTIAEELGQMLSVNRTFSLMDLFFSLLGIWLVICVDRIFSKMKNKKQEV